MLNYKHWARTHVNCGSLADHVENEMTASENPYEASATPSEENATTPSNEGPCCRGAILTGILFAITFPTLLTYIYFNVLTDFDTRVQQGVYGVGKIIQFGFPAAWAWFVLRERFGFSKPSWHGIRLGLGFGFLVLGSMLTLFHFWLEPTGFFAGPNAQIREKIVDMGFDSFWKYAGISVFYALCHSLMEEYYWRWFVFRQLRSLIAFMPAMLISSIGFMAHHVIVLKTFFGWESPATYLFSLAVAIGGVLWAWIYEKSGSLVGPWLSHLVVDAGIFMIGYHLARDLLL